MVASVQQASGQRPAAFSATDNFAILSRPTLRLRRETPDSSGAIRRYVRHEPGGAKAARGGMRPIDLIVANRSA